MKTVGVCGDVVGDPGWEWRAEESWKFVKSTVNFKIYFIL